MNLNMNIREKREAGFTLLELLIVVSIIAILSVALVLVLNPAEALKKSRDAQRMSDLSTIKTALGLLLTSTSTPSLDNTFGAAASTCLSSVTGVANIAAKVRYSTGTAVAYTAAGGGTDVIATGTFTSPSIAATGIIGDVAGAGWIPAVLSNLTGGSPISNYPTDPTNSVSASAVATDLVYRYACQNAGAAGRPGYVFEIDARLESDAYTITDNKLSLDGGDNTNLYEIGTSLKLLPTTATF